jgi:hypothetical protein
MKTWKPIAAGSALGLAVAGVLTLSPAFAQTAPSETNSGPVVGVGEVPTGQHPSTGTPTATLITATVEQKTNNGPSATVATDWNEQNGETQVDDGDLDNGKVGEEGQHGESVNENVDDQSKNPSAGSPGTAGANSKQQTDPSTSDPATGSDSSGNTGNNGDSNS